MNEDLELELEALQATYGDEAVTVSLDNAHNTIITLECLPRVADENNAYVTTQLVLKCTPDYPSTPPNISLEKPKGLLDGQLHTILENLRQEAHHLTGELQLGHLYEHAIDQLSEANHPNGDCIFCIKPLLSSSTAAAAEEAPLAVVKLSSCWHCFHRACFSSWFNWTQHRLAARYKEIHEEYKAMAGEQLVKEGIEKKAMPSSTTTTAAIASEDDNIEFVVYCPTCRAPVVPSSVEHLAEDLKTYSASFWTDQKEQVLHINDAGISDKGDDKSLRALQQRFAKVLQKQRDCGGLVEENVGVSVQEMQQAMENARLSAAKEEQQKQQQDAVANYKDSNNNAPAVNGIGRGQGGEQHRKQYVNRGYRGGHSRGRGRSRPPPKEQTQ